MSNTSASTGFSNYFEDNHDAVRELMDISVYFTRSDPRYAPQVYDYVLDELMKRWDALTSWSAAARTIARRYAAKLRRRESRLVNHALEEQHEQSLAAQAATPDNLALRAEEKERLGSAVAELHVEDRHILHAFANTKSMRDAAREISMPASTFRKRLHAIISELQQSLDV